MSSKIKISTNKKYTNISNDADQTAIINPLTNRPIKLGGRVHRQLQAKGVFGDQTRKAGRPKGTFRGPVSIPMKNKKPKKNVSYKQLSSSDDSSDYYTTTDDDVIYTKSNKNTYTIVDDKMESSDCSSDYDSSESSS